MKNGKSLQGKIGPIMVRQIEKPTKLFRKPIRNYFDFTETMESLLCMSEIIIATLKLPSRTERMPHKQGINA